MPKIDKTNIRRFPVKKNGVVVLDAKGKPVLGRPTAIFRYPDPLDPTKRKMKSATFATESECRDWLSTMRAKYLADPDALPRRSDKTTFTQAVATWKQRRYASLDPSSRKRYEEVLKVQLLPRFGATPVRKITRAVVRSYLIELQDTHAPATRDKVQTCMSSVLREAVEDGLIPANPCHGLNSGGKTFKAVEPKDLDVLTSAEVATLAEAINPAFHTLILTAAYSGMRAGELLALRRRDVDLERGVIHVFKAMKDWVDGEPVFGEPKTKRSRRDVDVLDQLAPVLADHLSPGGSPDDLVFTNTEGNPIRWQVFYAKHFTKTRDKALPDHPDYTFHDLRHCFCSWLLAAGVDPVTVAKQAGHSLAVLLSTYAHAIPKENGIKSALSPAANVVVVDFGKAAS